MLEGRRAAIHARRERKLEAARERRRSTRQLNDHKLAMQHDGCRVKRRPALLESNRAKG